MLKYLKNNSKSEKENSYFNLGEIKHDHDN